MRGYKKMPDISMCMNEECNIKEKCFRYMATPDKIQSYSRFNEDNQKKCGYYWPLSGVEDKQLLCSMCITYGDNYYEDENGKKAIRCQDCPNKDGMKEVGL